LFLNWHHINLNRGDCLPGVYFVAKIMFEGEIEWFRRLKSFTFYKR